MRQRHSSAAPKARSFTLSTARPRMATWLLAACGIWLIGLGAYFMFFRPALLPEDPRYIGTTLQSIQEAAPGLASWLRIVFTVMGGFMTGAGVLTLYLASTAVAAGSREAAWVLLIAGLPTVVLMSVMNFFLHSDFRWLLLVPAALWLAGAVAGFGESRR
jgi:hypothetical protein